MEYLYLYTLQGQLNIDASDFVLGGREAAFCAGGVEGAVWPPPPYNDKTVVSVGHFT